MDGLQARLSAEYPAPADAGPQGPPGAARPFLEASPSATYTTDAAGYLTFYNEAAVDLWGRRPDIGTARWCGSVRSFALDGAPLPHDRSALAQALEAGKTATPAEFWTERPDGTRTLVAPFPVLLSGSDGSVTGAVNTLVDLTAEAELRECNEHFRHAIELNPQMLWMADPRGNVLQFSKSWCSFTGQTYQEAVSTGWREVIHPSDLPAIRDAIADAKAQTGHDLRFRVRTAGGDYRWVRTRSVARRGADGKVIRWYGATEDVHDAVLSKAAMHSAEDRYRMVAEAADDIVWDLDVARDVVTWSESLHRRFGLSPTRQQSTREWWKDRIHPDDRATVAQTIATTMAGSGGHLATEYRFRRADGSYAHVLDRGSLIRDGAGRVIRAIGAMIDQTERKQSQAALQLSEERFRLAANAAGLGVADIDTVTGSEHWSVELRDILGIPADAPARAETYLALLHPEDREATMAHHQKAMRGELGDGSERQHRIIRPNDGGLRWIAARRHAMRNDAGEIVRVIVTNKDITEQKTTQDRITRAATYDTVTGLQNRTQFQSRLRETIEAAAADNDVVSVLLIDLDKFKRVNDTFGHQAGDDVLAAFAKRLLGEIPLSARFIRFGGDEFAIVLPSTDAAAAALLAQRLLEVLHPSFAIGGRNIDLRASIGVAMYPRDGSDASELVKSADIALYAAKAAGRETLKMFVPAMRQEVQLQLSMLDLARSALARGLIEPFYQPKVDLATGRVDGFEALLRWRDPVLGIQSPEQIASAFDETGLAGPIGDAMAEAVLADMRSWIDRGIAFGKIAINASAAEFRDAGYAERLLARLARHGVPASRLEVEITETAFLDDRARNVIESLETLRASGVTVALDDFGTGFSSLSHLRHFPVDTIKIDRSFVAGLDHGSQDRAIIEAVLQLGQALGMTTVAEGIETEIQAEFLRSHRCMFAQGFLFSTAVDRREVPAALARAFPPRRRKQDARPDRTAAAA